MDALPSYDTVAGATESTYLTGRGAHLDILYFQEDVQRNIVR